MHNFMVVITPQAKIALRKASGNEKRAFTNALREIAIDPLEERTEITFLSKRGKYDAYRFRSNVGLVVYLVESLKKEVIIIDLQPFKR